MVTPNFPNRTLAIMDNLAFLRATDNECIDLIAIDPPFAANETFEGKVNPAITNAEIGEERALAARHGPEVLAKWEEYEGKPENQSVTRVKDEWFFRNVEQDWMGELRDVGMAVRNWDRRIEDGERPPPGEAPTARERTLAAIGEVVEAVRAVATENEAAYIALMSVRLYECRRVLKQTGSIYVHCDYHANSYLRMLMDAIFGKNNFRNEIVWHYGGTGAPKSKFPAKHDNILFYTKTKNATFNPLMTEAAKVSGWTGKDEKRMDAVWNINTVFQSEERATRTGYATQKPLPLYQRIVKASSNPGDTVLDLFAGCATTAIAAEKEGRNWLACDMAYRASTMMMRRFYQNDIVLSNMNVDVVREAIGPHTGKMEYKSGRTIGPPDLAGFPRTTADPDEGTPDLKAPKRAPISTSWNGSIPKDKSKEILLAEYGPKCWGCNFDASRPNGTINRSQLEVDHIQARKAADGVAGDDELDNLALLCAYCNKHKGNRLTLAELRTKNAHDGVLYHVKTSGDLQPHEYAARRFAQQQMREYGQQARDG